MPQTFVRADHPGSKLRVVFFGTPEFAAHSLKGLIHDPYFDVVGVVTQQDELQGRKKVLTPPPVKSVALEHGVQVFQPTKMKDPDFHAALRALKADVFVIVAYGRILPDALLNIPKLGCVNVHPSLLPKWRGPSPMIAAIANGDKDTGVTIMKIDEAMDHGPILAQKAFALNENETTESLTQTVVHIGVPLLLDTLKAYHAGSITPREQDHSQATLCKLLSREDGVITWNESAEVIERKIRAFNPWPGTSSTFKRNDEPLPVKIFSAKIDSSVLNPGEVRIVDNRILVGTISTALEITELQPAGGKRMKAADFVRGYKGIE